MNELRMRFKRERMFRLAVYGLALALTFVNFPLVTSLTGGIWGHLDWGGRMVLLAKTIILGVATLGLYYVSNGIGAFVLVTGFLARLAAGFTALMAALTSWALGLGVLLQLILPPIIMAAGVLMGLIFAMALPVVFVPLMGFIARLGDTEEEDELILAKGLNKIHERRG